MLFQTFGENVKYLWLLVNKLINLNKNLKKLILSR